MIDKMNKKNKPPEGNDKEIKEKKIQGAKIAEKILNRDDVKKDKIDEILFEEALHHKIDKAREIFSAELRDKDDIVITGFIKQLEDSYETEVK
ncbi:hypothetical protein AMET1_0552 [Methanonatronarchaeum thermophilum]|uniref:Uncharacterized protein n=1 Tax=Methanonatronarchaeum thermophilum TaxID=1927129 RepID=A0A1Y3GBR3_9EURY|nr:hypothetical protein [Methanonatronarchaeum thermophilum]OUJ18901.1 hypothetical protein AMET1_0552 [Methanonatronarchaeum thermophilum]